MNGSHMAVGHFIELFLALGNRHMGTFVFLNCLLCTWGDNRGERETYDYNSRSYTLAKWDNLELIEVQRNLTITLHWGFPSKTPESHQRKPLITYSR